jgi:ABC-type lipoprotein release transport system permease subunit
MNAFGFAWRSLTRQPARSSLGILGVAAVGALLLDMLLLSEGLVVSMRDLLEGTGFDIRVTAGEALPGDGPRLSGAASVASEIAALPTVTSAAAVRLADARLIRQDAPPVYSALQGVAGSGRRPWTILRGRDVERTGEVVVNDAVTNQLGIHPGSTLVLRASCAGDSAPPAASVHVVGVAEFPFEELSERTVAGTLETLDQACGARSGGEADLILVSARGEPEVTAASIRSQLPKLQVLTNEQMIGVFQQSSFTYFRQISTVLTTVTISFALLLISVLLTVSVNQRLGEIAALRALGFSARRVVGDVLCESALIVGIGGLLSLPLGFVLASRLDRILKTMPGIPAALHFFVFSSDAVVTHVALLVVTAVVAALYPMRIVARLPIAPTLRNEVIS